VGSACVSSCVITVAVATSYVPPSAGFSLPYDAHCGVSVSKGVFVGLLCSHGNTGVTYLSCLA